jgi:hypothetical protein
MQEAGAHPDQLLCSFDGAVYGDREAKKMARRAGRDYISSRGPGQPRLVKTPLEPYSEAEWDALDEMSREVLEAAAYSADLDRLTTAQTAARDNIARYVDEVLEKEATHASLKETVVLRDPDGKATRFELVGVVDPLSPSNDQYGPEAGNRYVGIELRAEPVPPAVEPVELSLGAALVDDRGFGHAIALADNEPQFVLRGEGPPNQRHGYLVFEIPKDRQPLRFHLCVDETAKSAAWTLRPSGEATQVAPPNAPSAADALRIASERYARGEIGRDEFIQIRDDLRG